MTLRGVGKKTANVVYAVAFGGDAIAVDTHVRRVSNRLGLSDSQDVLKIEKDLNMLFPQAEWSTLHHLLIHHGRYVSPSFDEAAHVQAVMEAAYRSDQTGCREAVRTI